jgi:iron complex outermembrane receptor protein
VTGGIAWTHAVYAAFPAAEVATPATGGGNVDGPVDATGNAMIRAPRLSGNVGVSYASQAFGGALVGSLNEYFNSGYYWDPANRLQQPKYQILNAQAKWSPPNSHFSVTLWGCNLTNTRYELYVNEVAFGDQISYAAPRQYGVTFGWKL